MMVQTLNTNFTQDMFVKECSKGGIYLHELFSRFLVKNLFSKGCLPQPNYELDVYSTTTDRKSVV